MTLPHRTSSLKKHAKRRRPLVPSVLALAAAALSALLLFAPVTASGYTASITNSTNTVGSAASASFFTCDAAYAADRANAYYSYTLAQPSNSTTAKDTSGNGTGNGNGNGTGNRDGLFRGTMTTTTELPKACP